MKFTSQICTTKEQSEQLVALGLKKETADCHYEGRKNRYEEWEVAVIGGCYYSWDYPAWSLHRLMELCPLLMNPPRFLSISQHKTCYTFFRDGTDISFGGKSTYDNLIDCIKWLINENHFDNKYLNE